MIRLDSFLLQSQKPAIKDSDEPLRITSVTALERLCISFFHRHSLNTKWQTHFTQSLQHVSIHRLVYLDCMFRWLIKRKEHVYPCSLFMHSFNSYHCQRVGPYLHMFSQLNKLSVLRISRDEARTGLH